MTKLIATTKPGVYKAIEVCEDNLMALKEALGERIYSFLIDTGGNVTLTYVEQRFIKVAGTFMAIEDKIEAYTGDIFVLKENGSLFVLDRWVFDELFDYHIVPKTEENSEC